MNTNVPVLSQLLAQLPQKVRTLLYLALGVLSLIYTIYQISGGDWKKAVAALFAMLVAETARSNVGSQ